MSGTMTDELADVDIHMIEIARYPNLRLLAWQLHLERIGEADAFALYEREWRHVDPVHLGPEERELIRRLADTYGHGVLNV
jgi:hypothetical protein